MNTNTAPVARVTTTVRIIMVETTTVELEGSVSTFERAVLAQNVKSYFVAASYEGIPGFEGEIFTG